LAVKNGALNWGKNRGNLKPKRGGEINLKGQKGGTIFHPPRPPPPKAQWPPEKAARNFFQKKPQRGGAAFGFPPKGPFAGPPPNRPQTEFFLGPGGEPPKGYGGPGQKRGISGKKTKKNLGGVKGAGGEKKTRARQGIEKKTPKKNKKFRPGKSWGGQPPGGAFFILAATPLKKPPPSFFCKKNQIFPPQKKSQNWGQWELRGGGPPLMEGPRAQGGPYGAPRRAKKNSPKPGAAKRGGGNR